MSSSQQPNDGKLENISEVRLKGDSRISHWKISKKTPVQFTMVDANSFKNMYTNSSGSSSSANSSNASANGNNNNRKSKAGANKQSAGERSQQPQQAATIPNASSTCMNTNTAPNNNDQEFALPQQQPINRRASADGNIFSRKRSKYGEEIAQGLANLDSNHYQNNNHQSQSQTRLITRRRSSSSKYSQEEVIEVGGNHSDNNSNFQSASQQQPQYIHQHPPQQQQQQQQQPQSLSHLDQQQQLQEDTLRRFSESDVLLSRSIQAHKQQQRQQQQLRAAPNASYLTYKQHYLQSPYESPTIIPERRSSMDELAISFSHLNRRLSQPTVNLTTTVASEQLVPSPVSDSPRLYSNFPNSNNTSPRVNNNVNSSSSNYYSFSSTGSNEDYDNSLLQPSGAKRRKSAPTISENSSFYLPPMQPQNLQPPQLPPQYQQQQPVVEQQELYGSLFNFSFPLKDDSVSTAPQISPTATTSLVPSPTNPSGSAFAQQQQQQSHQQQQHYEQQQQNTSGEDPNVSFFRRYSIGAPVEQGDMRSTSANNNNAALGTTTLAPLRSLLSPSATTNSALASSSNY